MKMKITVAIFSSMIVILLAVIPRVSLYPTAETPVADDISFRKRLSVTDDIQLNKRPLVADVRRSIQELEQIERYYQHLLVRGYLQETGYRRLELLQQFIERLKDHVKTLVNAEQEIDTSGTK